MRTVLDLKTGEVSKILKTPEILRLNELGINAGETIMLLKVSPLKQNYLIGIRDTTISVKKETARQICVN